MMVPDKLIFMINNHVLSDLDHTDWPQNIRYQRLFLKQGSLTIVSGSRLVEK